MIWSDVRNDYPDQWLIIEALQAHTSGDYRRMLDQITVVDHPSDGKAAIDKYRQLQERYPDREVYFVYTSRKELDIRVRQWIGIRRAGDIAKAGAIINFKTMEIDFQG